MNQLFAIETLRRRLSIAAVAGWSDACAEWLKRAGLLPEQVIGVAGPVGPEYLIALLGIWKAGGISLTLNPRLPALQQEQALRTAGARWCLGGEGARRLDWAELPSAGPPTGQRALPLNPETPLSMILTSGSSGPPKVALHSYANHLTSLGALFERMPLGPEDRWLLALPLFHIGGLAILMRCHHVGASVVLPEPGDDLAEALIRLRPSHLSLVATQLQRLLAQPEAAAALQQARMILLGGSAIPRSLIERAIALKLPIHTSYGATETSSLVTLTPPGARLETLLTSGSALPGHRLRIAVDGEIQIDSRAVFEGYFSSAAEFAALARPVVMPAGDVCQRGPLPSSVFAHPYRLDKLVSDDLAPESRRPWLRTRDRGYIDETGRLRVLGRLDNLFISGGENIQPEEVEKALLTMPGIIQAIVVPVPDAEYGQRPVAFIEAADWAPEAWLSALRQLLPSFKLPDRFHPWPQEQIGLKPSRKDLQNLAEASLSEGLSPDV